MSARRIVTRPATSPAIQPLERRTLFALAFDPGFGDGGIINNALDPDPQGFSQDIGFIHLLSDGKILVGGSAFPGGEPGMRVARYTAGGVLDTTFSGDGFSPLIM